MSNKPAEENQRQNGAFLAYSSIPDPSLQKLHQEWAKYVPRFKKPSFRTLKSWSAKYQWVERSKAIHQEAKEQATKKTVEQLAMAKEEVLAITRVVMIRYGQQLQENTQGKITALDFEKAWKIQRIEMGLPTEIGKHEHEVDVDVYAGVSDEKLLEELESLTKRYKEKLTQKK